MGTHRDTGERLEGVEDVTQAVGEILRTPLRSRVMRPDFGSDPIGSVDAPMNETGRTRIFGKTAGAVVKWEPRLRLERTTLDGNADGELTIGVEGTYEAATIEASSAVAGLTAARRVRDPAAYFDYRDYDLGERVWPDTPTTRRLRGLATHPNAPPVHASLTGPAGLTALGLRFPPGVETVDTITGLSPLWSGHIAPADNPMRRSRPWTVGVAFAINSPGTRNQFVWTGVGPFNAGGGVDDPVAWLQWVDDGNPNPGLRFMLSTGGTSASLPVVGASGDGLQIAWGWHIPRDGSTPRRAGTAYANGEPSVVELDDEPDHADAPELPDPSIGTISYLLGIDPFVQVGVELDGAIAFFGIWPRVLTRRERMGMTAHWRRELGL
jgi:phage baseplate assembly protein W